MQAPIAAFNVVNEGAWFSGSVATIAKRATEGFWITKGGESCTLLRAPRQRRNSFACLHRRPNV